MNADSIATNNGVERLTIPIRRELLDQATTSRVAIDAGSLLTKMVFVTSGTTAGEYELNFLLMENGQFDRGIEIVRRECDLLQGDGGDVLKVTGVGYKHERQYHELLNASSEFVVEPLCWIRGYHWAVENLSSEDLFYAHERSDPCFCKRGSNPCPSAAELELLRLTEDTQKTESSSASTTAPICSSFATSQCTNFPAILVNAGSSVGMCIVNERGEALQLSLSFFSCKTLAGLASLLLGTSDFAELVRLAEFGDRGRVDLKIDEMRAEDPLHPFGAYNGDIPLVHLGKIADAAVQAGAVKREDVARSLVSLFSFNLFSTILSFAAGAQISNVYIGGSCFRHALFRREFENARAFQLHHSSFRHHFLRIGSQVGCIGALVSSNSQVPSVLKFPS